MRLRNVVVLVVTSGALASPLVGQQGPRLDRGGVAPSQSAAPRDWQMLTEIDSSKGAAVTRLWRHGRRVSPGPFRAVVLQLVCYPNDQLEVSIVSSDVMSPAATSITNSIEVQFDQEAAVTFRAARDGDRVAYLGREASTTVLSGLTSGADTLRVRISRTPLPPYEAVFGLDGERAPDAAYCDPS